MSAFEKNLQKAKVACRIGIALSAALLAITIISCSTDTGDANKDKAARIANAAGQELFTAALQIGLSAGEGAVNGYAEQHGASAIFDNPSAVQIDGAAAVQHLIAAAAGPSSAPVASAAATLFTAANPQTPAQKVQVANTIAAGLQAGAAQVIFSNSQP